MNSGNGRSLFSRSACETLRRNISGSREVEGSRYRHVLSSKRYSSSFVPDANGRPFPRKSTVPRVPSTNISSNGQRTDSFFGSGRQGLPSMTRWRGYPGDGKVSTGQWSRRPWPLKPSDRTLPTGEKNGSKRHILVDGRGVPLSIVVTGANRHDVSQLENVLDAVVVERPETRQTLLADKGYHGKPAEEAIREREYVPRVIPRGKEIQEKRKNPKKKHRRWVVEVSHSWFNRFRKLLVRFEKLALSYEALLHFAAAIIAFRKIGKISVIYG